MNEFAYADNKQPPNVLLFNQGASSGRYLFIVETKYFDEEDTVFLMYSLNSSTLQVSTLVYFNNAKWSVSLSVLDID